MSRSRDSVSEKIDYLFSSVRRADGREHTYDDIESGTKGRVSRSYVWKLRHGRNNNPSLDVIEALAEFFNVPPSYFFGPSLERDEEAGEAAEVAALVADPAARSVAESARGLSISSLTIVRNLIEDLQLIDRGLPPKRRKRSREEREAARESNKKRFR